jgi:hypothetical protein
MRKDRQEQEGEKREREKERKYYFELHPRRQDESKKPTLPL